jgi:hypothetical protein
MAITSRCARAAALLTLGLAGCGGGGSSSNDPSPSTAGIAVPQEISALPTKAEAPPAAALRALDAAPGGDYAAARTMKFVDERELRQFDILNVIFGALEQTHYADPENVGAGPYGVIVSWVEERDGREEKTLKRWVVDSRMLEEDGRPVNRVQVWSVEGGEPGDEEVIRAELDIYEAPTQNADGSYEDYGVWRLLAKPGGATTAFFAAAASREAGLSRVAVREVERPGVEKAGILLRSQDEGFGKVLYPEWNCEGPGGCDPTLATVAYAYDAAHVALQKGEGVVYKSRTEKVDVVTRYGLYDAETGADVTRARSFGFPVRFTIGGAERYGYYGAWQGRHQLWANGEPVPAGLTAVRGDRGPDGPQQAYETSDQFPGVLVRRTYAPASLTELQGMILNTWVNESAELTFDGSGWSACWSPTWSPMEMEMSCGSSGPVADLGFLVANPEDRLRSVFINRWDEEAGAPVTLVYDGAEFRVAAPGHPPVPTETVWTPVAGDRLWVNVNGSVYVVHDGDGWLQKEVLAFDEATWTPTFGENDAPFSFSAQGDHFLHANGVTYVLRPAAGGGFDLEIERQTVANPVNTEVFLPDGVRFRRAWGGDTASTFRFGATPGTGEFMKLVYDVPGPQDEAAGKVPGHEVTEELWNLVAILDGVETGESYGWEYPQGDQGGWGSQQFLIADGEYLVLDDPIRLTPITLQDGGGGSRSYALQFDGSWVGGLPDVFDLLRRAGYQLTPEIAAQVVNIPEGALVADAMEPGRQYRFKPLQICQYLTTVKNPGGLDLGPANALDLDDAPALVDNGVGEMPDVPLKYSEGVLVSH